MCVCFQLAYIESTSAAHLSWLSVGDTRAPVRHRLSEAGDDRNVHRGDSAGVEQNVSSAQSSGDPAFARILQQCITLASHLSRHWAISKRSPHVFRQQRRLIFQRGNIECASGEYMRHFFFTVAGVSRWTESDRWWSNALLPIIRATAHNSDGGHQEESSFSRWSQNESQPLHFRTIPSHV